MKKRTAVFILTAMMALGVPLHGAPLKLTGLYGKWQLMYRGNYGYHFHFQKNFRVLCMIYLNTRAVVFKGVYSLENDNTLRINISEMKTEENISQLNMYSRFVKTSSSYFLFNGSLEAEGGRAALELAPRKIVIDGNDSEGYFESRIRLKKI